MLWRAKHMKTKGPIAQFRHILICLLFKTIFRGLTKQSKIVYHDKSYSFEVVFGWLIRFNGKKTFETKYPWEFSPYKSLHYSPKPCSDVYYFRLNFDVLKLGYYYSMTSLRKQPRSREVATWALAKWPLSNECRNWFNSILMTCHYSGQGSTSDWLKWNSLVFQPIRGTT